MFTELEAFLLDIPYIPDPQPHDTHAYCLPIKPETKKRLEEYETSRKVSLKPYINEQVDEVIHKAIDDCIASEKG